MNALFEQWLELKENTRVRTAMWLSAGAPEVFPYIDDVITISEASAAFRAAALAAAPAARRECLKLAREELGLDIAKPRQAPTKRWLSKTTGARKIQWVPPVAARPTSPAITRTR